MYLTFFTRNCILSRLNLMLRSRALVSCPCVRFVVSTGGSFFFTASMLPVWVVGEMKIFNCSWDCSVILHNLMAFSSVKSVSRSSRSRSLESFMPTTIWSRIRESLIAPKSEYSAFLLRSVTNMSNERSSWMVILQKYRFVGCILPRNTVRFKRC